MLATRITPLTNQHRKHSHVENNWTRSSNSTKISREKYVTSPSHCPLKKEYRITNLSSDFISNITHDATPHSPPGQGEGNKK